jgi:CheY-like chemotaxis protein
VGRFGADVILVDVGLPGGGGYEFCRQLKRDLDTAAIPVILLAGSLEPVDVDQMAWAGADGSLTKPFETSHLVELIDEMVHRRRIQRDNPVEVASTAEGEVPQPVERFRSARPGVIFELTREDCYPRFRILVSQAWQSSVPPELTDEQFQAILRAVSEQLPQTLRELLPALTRQILRQEPS